MGQANSNAEKLSQYFIKAFDRRKRHSVDISKKLLATEDVRYHTQTRAVTTGSLKQRHRSTNCPKVKKEAIDRNLMNLPLEIQEQLKIKEDRIKLLARNR